MSFPSTSKVQRDGFEMVRSAMIDRLRQHYNIADERVLGVMADLPRHLFVPDALRPQAYKDNALPISGGQTISQPFIVARMTELLEVPLVEVGLTAVRVDEHAVRIEGPSTHDWRNRNPNSYC